VTFSGGTAAAAVNQPCCDMVLLTNMFPKMAVHRDICTFVSLTVGFSDAMMPGSLLTYTLRPSLSVGRRAGFIMDPFNLFGISGVAVTSCFFGGKFMYPAITGIGWLICVINANR